MKLYHFTILFVFIVLAAVIVMDIKTKDLKAMVNEEEKVDHAFNTAVDDGTTYLLQSDAERGIVLDKEDAVDTFFQSLYASLGIMVAADKQELIQAYVPVIAVTADDGYYINYSDEYLGSDGYTYFSKRWSEKFPYYYEDDNFIYGFTLSDNLSIYDKNNILDVTGEKKIFYLDYHELQSATQYQNFRNTCPGNFTLNDETFLLIRKEAIIKELEESMSFYINKHNLIAKEYGITYTFSLPTIDNSELVRSIDNPSLIVIFQGYPYGSGIDSTYNRVTVAGAKLSKKDVYYLEQRSWYYLYHKADCDVLKQDSYLIDKEHPYYSIEDCVKKGAYACPICNEGGVHVPDYMK